MFPKVADESQLSLHRTQAAVQALREFGVVVAFPPEEGDFPCGCVCLFGAINDSCHSMAVIER